MFEKNVKCDPFNLEYEDDWKIVKRFNKKVEVINKREEQNLMIPITIIAVQGEAKALGINNTPIYCEVSGLNKDENEGSLISNGDFVFFIDDISTNGTTVKLYLFGAGHDEYVSRTEFKKDFFVLC
jgi:hypothetical protein